ncbi:hypothetical protein EDB19DRAFT_1391026 [Suillus lakei]|nr:hypothetical protein EDB19DRAFT_1391026 [Suillus lakei]
MDQSTSDTSSSTAPDFCSAPQYMPNTGMYMGHLAGPEGAYVPYPGYPTQFHDPYGVLPNMTHAGTLPYAPVVPLPPMGPGVVHNSFQVAQNVHHPSAVVDVSHAIHCSPYPPLTEAGPPPQHPYAPPLYNQPNPSNYFPGAMAPYEVQGAHPNNPPILHNPYFQQHHGAQLVTGSTSSFTPPASGSLASRKRVTEDPEDRAVKRIKTRGIKNDRVLHPC